jgi:hypothetical protein
LALQPGAIVTAPDQGWRLRVFGRAELAGSAEMQGSPGVVRILDDGSDGLEPIGRAGGLELTIGVGVGLWYGIEPRR